MEDDAQIVFKLSLLDVIDGRGQEKKNPRRRNLRHGFKRMKLLLAQRMWLGVLQKCQTNLVRNKQTSSPSLLPYVNYSIQADELLHRENQG